MDGLSIHEVGQTLVIQLPFGYTVDKLRHQKAGSHGTADPLDLREQVVIKLMPIEE